MTRGERYARINHSVKRAMRHLYLSGRRFPSEFTGRCALPLFPLALWTHCSETDVIAGDPSFFGVSGFLERVFGASDQCAQVKCLIILMGAARNSILP